MDGRALSELRQLALRDKELSDDSADLRRRDEEVAAIRAGADAVHAFLEAYPETARRRTAELADAAGDLDDRNAELGAAEQALATAVADEDAREHAERVRARAADHVAVARARVDRAEAAVAELERDAEGVPARLGALFERAQTVEGVPPPSEASELVDWASRAHAELFVEARQVDAQRDRVIREANELASMLLGEATYGATAAQALARAEAHCVSSPGQVSESR